MDGDFIVALFSHDDGFIPKFCRWNIRNVDGDGVHGHPADEWRTPAMNEHSSLVAHAWEPVAVAERQHRDAPRVWRCISHTVADRVARPKVLDSSNARLNRHHRLKARDAAAY